MNQNKGITLISLIVTIIILLILVTVGTNVGKSLINEAKYNNTISQMKLMQTKVNELYEEYKNGTVSDENIGETIPDTLATKANQAFQTAKNNNRTEQYIGENVSDYKYLSSDYIKNNFGIEKSELDYIVSIKYRTVILLDGVKKDGVIYYSLNEIEDEQYNVEYINPTVVLSKNGGTYIIPTRGSVVIENTFTIVDRPKDTNINLTLEYAWSTSKDIEPEASSWQTPGEESLIKEITEEETYYLWTRITNLDYNINNIQVSKPFYVKIRTSMLKVEEETVNENSTFLGGKIKRKDIESIEFTNSIENHKVSDENCWDVSDDLSKTILAWYTDENNDGYFEVKIGSVDGKVVANTNSRNLLAYIGFNGNDSTCIYGLNLLDTNDVEIMDYMFQYCGYNAMTALNLGDFETSNVTSMQFMFYNCGYNVMNTFSLGNNFNTSNVENMKATFSYLGYITLTELDLGGKFNTSKVTTMENLFNKCGHEAMKNLILGSYFDTSNVSNMHSMFEGCTALSAINISNFNTENVTDIGSMFRDCQSLTSINLSSFNTSNVTDMSLMFYACNNVTIIILSNDFKTKNVINMHSMFNGCSSLTTIDLSSFDTTNVTDMCSMFRECQTLTTINLSNFITTNVTNMENMFAKCTNLTTINISKFNTSKVTSMGWMFRDCGNLTTINVNEDFSQESLQSSVNMFNGCFKIKGGNNTIYDDSYTDARRAKVDRSGVQGYFSKQN